MSAMEVDASDPPEEPDPLQEALAAAPEAADPGAAYLAILTGFQDLTLSEEGVRAKEECVYKLAERDVRAGRYDAVVDLLQKAAPFFGSVAKAGGGVWGSARARGRRSGAMSKRASRGSARVPGRAETRVEGRHSGV